MFTENAEFVPADVELAGEAIVKVAPAGTLDGEEVLDVSGRYVTPGFVDIPVSYTHLYRRCKGSDEGLPEKAEGRAPFQGARLPPGRRREKPMQRRSMRFYPSISERSKSSGSSSERSAASSAAVRRAAARMASSSLLRARRPLPACRARASCTALK